MEILWAAAAAIVDIANPPAINPMARRRVTAVADCSPAVSLDLSRRTRAPRSSLRLAFDTRPRVLIAGG
jgi:hypothetical protein